jgi:hypothetical protein
LRKIVRPHDCIQREQGIGVRPAHRHQKPDAYAERPRAPSPTRAETIRAVESDDRATTDDVGGGA